MRATASENEQRHSCYVKISSPSFMNYTNLDSRLKMHSLSPSFLRRLKRIRAASLKARGTSSKKNPPAASAEVAAS